VREPGTGKVCGHIVAGHPGTKDAYIILWIVLSRILRNSFVVELDWLLDRTL
jgi:hypothetical protein